MLTRSVVPTLLCVGLAAGGCAGKQAPDPFQVPRSEFDAIRVIAVGQVPIPEEVSDRESVQASFDSLIAEQLTAAGFDVIHASDLEPLRQKLQEAAGPLYDPHTGEPDSARVRAYRESVIAALRDSVGAQAFMEIGLHVVGADYAGGTARWDGASQTVQSFGNQLLLAMAGLSKSGTVPALSLHVEVYDTDSARLLYDRAGGLSVLANHRGDELLPDEVFGDPARNAEAVRIALEPLRLRNAAK